MTATGTTFHERCRTVVGKLVVRCQDRAVCSALRPLLTGLPDAQIRALRYLPPRQNLSEELFFLIAGLVAEYPCPLPEQRVSLGESLRQLARHPEVNAGGIEQRLDLLLQLERDALTQPLHGLVVQARGARIPIDFGELFYHLHFWEDPERWVQLRWAKHFWCAEPEEEQPSNSDNAK